MEELLNEDLVEYRADHMTLEELEHLSVETKFYNIVLNKLMTRGAKVIVGPRGVGKTHHMRLAYKQCIEKKTKPLPVYVSFSKYLRLEPLRSSSSIAIQYFHCWVLSKILLAVKDTLSYQNVYEDEVLKSDVTWADLELFCEQIEKQQTREWHSKLLDYLSVNVVIEFTDKAIELCKRKSAVILCDDAALVLTKDYMIEFFDIFRSLKTARISPKASVYPSTEFGPRFHIGQDAEPVPCWPSIEDSEYQALYKTIYDKRFDFDLKEEVKMCFAYASFGVPRAFINLINRYQMLSGKSEQNKVNTIIREQAQLLIDEYMSLSIKQPQFSKYVVAGKQIINQVSKLVSKDNAEKLKQNKQQYILGISQDGLKSKSDQKKIDTIVKLLEEIGLIHKLAPVRHGRNADDSPRVYDRYIPHYTLLLNDGALQIGSSGYITTFLNSISKPKAQPFRKKSFVDFYDKNSFSELSLDLPDCSTCGNARATEDQRFCMYCGSELVNPSMYRILINTKVEELPITAWLKERIKSETNIETIGDIALSNNSGQELMKARGIGKIKATKVIDHAKDWMEEYLS
ncbi:hypothetical protein P3576_03700 [Vibrio parahaemolyticus]|uniref:ORC-CDC6 family AAA ATPase n=2 Tax=Vibrio parahaemolyticus TaxID=670 RepID=UPI001122832F|nr:hypothetical protein [Vibrio parahaemolyticus]EHH2534499.1 hypothetical protein [Vibrio parahaemolyticus]EJB8444477.1 hypothetical protein [Vibrio parahaemolyticus]ELA8087723.1 hypothetical protein [Vibrio parahaemolyticus]ELA8204133.1 hypothetical protein [Vibrio parahaemolyticus]ELB2006821.1 hypothetical protein [Vibrio parahaemolyticus]